MYKFKDSFFSNEYNRYLQTRNEGLKKQSNKILEKLMLYFDELDEGIKSEICTEFCILRFEKDEIRDFNFFLHKRILAFLESACVGNQMPHLRWHYQLTRDEEKLERAYKHIERDEKTIYLAFNCLLSSLFWGAHHLPSYCIIEESECDRLLGEAQKFIEIHAISERQKESYLYYKMLYDDWWAYQSGDFDYSFGEWCANQNRDYGWVATYYFEGRSARKHNPL